jgi:hypothetical protein
MLKEKRSRIKTPTPQFHNRAMMGIRRKKNSYSSIYITRTQKSFSSRLDNGQVRTIKGAPTIGKALIPTCNAQYAVLSSRDLEVPLRIEAHIEDASQGGYHYNIPCIE